MRFLILDLNKEKKSLHSEEFVKPVENIVKKITSNYEIIHFKEKYIPNNYEKIILCGVSLKDFEYIKHLDSFNWIKEIKIPVFGICAGAHIITLLHQKNLEENQEIGLSRVEKEDENQILKDLKFPMEIYSLHNKIIQVPNNFKILLKNQYPQLLQKNNLYVCQFHPEVRNHKLIENFLNLS